MIRLGLLVLFVALTLGPGGPAAARAARQASPPSAQAGPGCGGATPQAADELVALAFPPSGTPAAPPAAPTPVASEAELPPGEPADPATAAAVEQVVQTWLACLLAGQEAMAFAHMTDDLDAAVVRQLADLPTANTPDELRTLLEAGLEATPGAGTAAAVATPGRGVRVLPDGRVGGIWAVGGNEAFVILEQEDGRWLVDEVIDILEAATPVAGTPAA